MPAIMWPQRMNRLAQSSENSGDEESNHAPPRETKMTGSVQAIFDSGSPTSCRTRKWRSAAPPMKMSPTSIHAFGALVSMAKWFDTIISSTGSVR